MCTSAPLSKSLRFLLLAAFNCCCTPYRELVDSRRTLPSPSLDGAPWRTNTWNNLSQVVVIVSTRRGASTEMAENVGRHPCGESLNELLVHAHVPDGYAKYKSASLTGVLHITRLRHELWLSDALAVREQVCQSRPKAVVDVCGHVCLVALKMHLDNNHYINSSKDPYFVQLITSPHVRTVVVQRDTFQNYCSIQKMQMTHDYGHTPATHHSDNISIPKCVETSQSKAWAKKVEERFDSARRALERHGRKWLEMPFAKYVANQEDETVRLLNFLGLQKPPSPWWGACGAPWCQPWAWPLQSAAEGSQ